MTRNLNASPKLHRLVSLWSGANHTTNEPNETLRLFSELVTEHAAFPAGTYAVDVRDASDQEPDERRVALRRAVEKMDLHSIRDKVVERRLAHPEEADTLTVYTDMCPVVPTKETE